jgi:hypothetical protein
MSDAQVKAYLEAHPEVAAAAVGGAKAGDVPVALPAGGDTAGGGNADWVQKAQESKPKAASGSWWGGGKKAAAPAAASDAYVPPVVPVAAPYSAPSATAPALPGAATGSAAFGIDDENPFKQ